MTAKKTLVVELWALGDSVIMTSILQMLETAGREVCILCKPATAELLRPSYPAARFITWTAPWTAFRGKYRLWRWRWREITGVIGELRSIRFDEAVSVRTDPRDHMLMRMVGATTRCGFPTRMSGMFLNAPVQSVPRRHRVEDWHVLGERLLGANVDRVSPMLRAEAYQSSPTPETPNSNEPVLVLHCGAGHPIRRWSISNFETVIRKLRTRYRFQLWLIPDGDGFGSQLAELADAVFSRLSWAELVRLLARADLFLGNDSGPGHLAAAVGTPTVSVFGPQDPSVFTPFGTHSLGVARDVCQYRPCFDSCRFDEPICLTRLECDAVLEEIGKQLEQWVNQGALPATFRR